MQRELDDLSAKHGVAIAGLKKQHEQELASLQGRLLQQAAEQLRDAASDKSSALKQLEDSLSRSHATAIAVSLMCSCRPVALFFQCQCLACPRADAAREAKGRNRPVGAASG